MNPLEASSSSSSLPSLPSLPSTSSTTRRRSPHSTITRRNHYDNGPFLSFILKRKYKHASGCIFVYSFLLLLLVLALKVSHVTSASSSARPNEVCELSLSLPKQQQDGVCRLCNKSDKANIPECDETGRIQHLTCQLMLAQAVVVEDESENKNKNSKYCLFSIYSHDDMTLFISCTMLTF